MIESFLTLARLGAPHAPWMKDCSFFVRRGEGFDATPHTRGPWSNTHQHGGPPAALIARRFEQLAGPMVIARLSYELLRPVPIGHLEIRTSLLRDGRKVRAHGATLHADGKVVTRASALCVRRADVLEQAPTRGPRRPMPSPEESARVEFPFFKHEVGYHRAMELRIGDGGIGQGHACAWLRMLHPLVEGEAPSPLVRLVIAADSGNGVSAALDHTRHTFINPDLVVHVVRLPRGEWIGLQAETFVGADGHGLADDLLHDAEGPLGRATQSLLIDRAS